MNKLPTPKCNKCKSSSNMVDHDGEWVCHSTHRENQSATPRTDAHQMIDGMAHDHLWSNFAETLERELQQANDYADRLVEHKDMVCLPADLANLREANTYFAIENEALKAQRDLLIEALEKALNATVLNHRKERWHSDAEYALHKIKLNK